MKLHRLVPKKIAALCGYFFCPVCESFYRTKDPVMMGGHTLCGKCVNEEISRRIKGWYGDFK